MRSFFVLQDNSMNGTVIELRATWQSAFDAMKYDKLAAGFEGFLPNKKQLPLVRQDNFDSLI